MADGLRSTHRAINRLVGFLPFTASAIHQQPAQCLEVAQVLPMHAGHFGELVEIDGDQFRVDAVIDLRAFAETFEVFEYLPKLGNQRVVSADRGLSLQRHAHQRFLCRGNLVFIERAHQAQAIHQSHQLAVVLDNPFNANVFEFA
ncbi:hypothetical protein D3C87_911440 [compost metagenome]